MDNGKIYEHFATNHKDIFMIANWVECTCFLCKNNKFPSLGDLKDHLDNIKDQDKWAHELVESLHKSKSPGKILCKFCQTFVEITSLHSHFRIKHIEVFVHLPWDLCQRCSTRFPGKDFLENHKCLLSSVIPNVAVPKKQSTNKHLQLSHFKPKQKRKEAGPLKAEPPPKFLKLTFPVPANACIPKK